MRRILIASVLCAATAALLAPAAFAQDSLLGANALATDSGRFRLKVELKMNARASTALDFPILNTGAPFPVVESTVSPHSSFEISDIELAAEGDLTTDISARVVLHVLDLYNQRLDHPDQVVFGNFGDFEMAAPSRGVVTQKLVERQNHTADGPAATSQADHRTDRLLGEYI